MHNLEIGSAGQVAFATREVPAWHMLGTVFDESEHVTTAQMLQKAYLDKWDVRLSPLVPFDAEQARWTVEHYAVLRTNPFDRDEIDALSVVGGRYKIVQNEDLFAFGDNLLDGGGQWETAGSISGGRRVFGSLKIDREIIIDANGAADAVNPYLLVCTSHDGSVGVQAATTPVRVVCQNTLNYALAGVKQSFKMRHTQSIEGRVAAARDALSLAHKHLDAFEAEAAALYATSITNRQFGTLVANLYPKPEDDKKGALTRWDNKVNILSDLFSGSAPVEGAPITGANIAGTAWGALNALTERLDWYRTARKGDASSVAEAASGFSAVQNAEKARIISAVRTLVSA